MLPKQQLFCMSNIHPWQTALNCLYLWMICVLTGIENTFSGFCIPERDATVCPRAREAAKSLFSVGHPYNYKDDLRMITPKPVAAREGAMKDYAENCYLFWWMLHYIICFKIAGWWKGAQGWQNLFATETVGLFQAGNCVASAEQTSAAQYTAARGVEKCYDLLCKSGSVFPLNAIIGVTLQSTHLVWAGADIYVDKYQPPNKKEIPWRIEVKLWKSCCW